ncbi:MAG TPA: acetyl-CoA carboxylase, carboxyltransferase subunit beta [Clostridiaceae bacterium]|nr:acetyl-CoA carboxylase, carboxyltransferase subunit beta [Clostridiaceae bacterium]
MKESFDIRREQLKESGKYTKLRSPTKKKKISEKIFTQCPGCKQYIYDKILKENLYVCPDCGKCLRIGTKTRFELTLDPSYELIDELAVFQDPIQFAGYQKKWENNQKKAGVDEAITFARGTIKGEPVIVGVMDCNFMMGSMGSIVGDRIIKAFAKATREKLPVIIFTASGGARMQEAIISLMQMRYVSEAVGKFQKAGGLYITVLTDPTTGGVTASFASLGNIILAEPNALIAFAGPRVIEETIQQKLPKGFQRAEHLLEHGFVDSIVLRKNLKNTLSLLLKMHNPKQTEVDLTQISGRFSKKLIKKMTNEAEVDPDKQVISFDRVLKARDPKRITPRQVLKYLCDDIFELSGDRLYADDPTICAGIARLGGLPITFVYTKKGKDLKSQIKLHFGMPHPEGYRKARRLMQEAENFGRPILTIIDTPGAYPGLESENRGMGEAIAQNLRFMSGLTVPTIAIITGEAGSGGAIALACTDKLFMLENAIYTILSPEGFATILWKDSAKVEEASEQMKLTAHDMVELEVCDQVFPDDLTGLKEALAQTFNELIKEKQMRNERNQWELN